MISKLFMGSTLLCAVGCAILFGFWKGAVAEVEGLQAQVTLLSNANEAHKVTIGTLTDLAASNAESIQALGEQKDAINTKTDEIRNQLEVARVGAREATLANSFIKSADAYDRRKSILMRIDVTNPAYSGADNPSLTETEHSQSGASSEPSQ